MVVRRLLLGAVALALAVPGALAALDRLLPPDLGRYESRSVSVLDRDGRVLRSFTTAGGAWRFGTSPDQVAPVYLRMLIAAEDKRFWTHPGVDPLALVRATGQALRAGRIVSGGSTITMQAARLLEPRPRTLASKLIEMLRAVQLERRFSKEEILGIYLTLAPMGGNLEGVRAGSLAWFGKEPARLTDAEAALLVALPRAPERLRPDRAAAAAQGARDRLLMRLADRGLLDAGSAAAAARSPIPTERWPMPLLAAHLAERLAAGSDREVIPTTLEAEIQARAERVARQALDTLPPPINVAVLVADHQRGEFVAYLGSGAYLDGRRSGMLDFARAVRSPGSTLKPFIYGLAFAAGLAHPASLVRDAPERFDDYAPDNFTEGFDGEVTVREALQRSLNLPAVRVLERLGPVTFAEQLERAGVGLTFDPDTSRPELPLALGGAGVTLVDLLHAYAGLAHGGRVPGLRLSPDGLPPPERSLMPERAAAQVAAILAGVPPPPGAMRLSIAFKTGTSHRFRDGWALGFDARHVVGVWVGRPDGGRCRPCSGVGTAARLLHQVFTTLPSAPLMPAHELVREPVPPALARLDSTVPSRRVEAGPRITFPPADALLASAASSRPVPLQVASGERPYRWLIDGQPVGGPAWRQKIVWRDPPAAGFVRIAVIDARGRGDSVVVRFERDPDARPAGQE